MESPTKKTKITINVVDEEENTIKELKAAMDFETITMNTQLPGEVIIFEVMH